MKHLTKAAGVWALALLTSLTPLYGQVDSVFWFAPPEVSAQHEDRPITLRITASVEDVQIRVTMPANPSFPAQNFSLAAGATRSLVYTNVNLLETFPYGAVRNTGLRIEGDGLFTAVYEVGEGFNIDTFVLKGGNAMGQDFMIPGQTRWENENQFLSDAWSSFEIVATENNTLVSVVPSLETDAVAAGDTLRIILQQGQTYSVRALSREAATSLAGSVVTSNRPIAITLTDDSLLKDGCYDLTGDQIVPVGILGQEYIVGPAELAGEEFAFATAVVDSTAIYLNNSDTPSLYLNRGETGSLALTGPRYITTSAPIALMHYTGIGCEIGAALVPSVNCKGSVSVPFVRSSSEEFYLSILVQQGGIDQFSLNGSRNFVGSENFSEIPSTNGIWYRALIGFSTDQLPTNQAFTLTNESFSFQLGVIDGGPGSGTRYGYYSNFSSLYIGDDLTLCPGESTTLVARADQSATFEWSDGSTEPTLEVSDPGTYWVRATNAFGCVLTDTLVVEASEPEFLNLPDTVVYCEGTPLELSTRRGYFDYQWNGGAETTRSIMVTDTGRVSLQVRNAAGCADSDTVYVTQRTPPTLDLGPDTTLCPGDSLWLDASVGEAATYTWWNAPGDSTYPAVYPSTYWVTVEAENCVLRDTVVVSGLNGPNSQDILGSTTVCPGVRGVGYSVADSLGSSYEWTINGGNPVAPATGPSLSVDWGSTNPEAEVRLVETTPEGCVGDTLRLPVRVQVRLAPALPDGPDWLCTEDTAQTYATSFTAGSVYAWHLGGGGTLVAGQGSDRATVQWDTPGTWPLWVDERSATTDTVCAGTSDTLWVTVFEDTARLSITRVTRPRPESTQVLITVAASGFPAQTPLSLFRRSDGEEWNLLSGLLADSVTTSDLPNLSTHAYYEYRLEGTNQCGELLQSLPHPTLTVQLDTFSGETEIRWNPYTGWGAGVESYALYRSLDGNPTYELLTTVPGNVTSWDYTDPQAGFVHRFYVEARGANVEQHSLSHLDSTRYANPLGIPTAFTPNGDGINDTFVLENLRLYQPNTFTVFNRYGDPIYRQSGYLNEWDGGPLPTGVYFWLLESPLLPAPVRGTVTLIR